MMESITQNKLNRITSRYQNQNCQQSDSKGILATEENKKFISLISHNIKNSFGALLGYSELILDDFDNLTDMEKKLYISEIRNTSKFTLKYFERFMEWTYIKTGKFIPSFENINLRTLISKVFEKAYTEINFLGEATFEIDGNHEIKADFQTTSKLFYYIIENALSFADNNGSVKIRSKMSYNYIQVDIINNGQLLNRENLLLALDPSTHFSTKENGTGLGIILADEFAKLNKGKIVFNETDEGFTMVSIILPTN